MFSYEELGVGGLVGRFLRGGVLLDRVNALIIADRNNYGREFEATGYGRW